MTTEKLYLCEAIAVAFL